MPKLIFGSNSQNLMAAKLKSFTTHTTGMLLAVYILVSYHAFSQIILVESEHREQPLIAMFFTTLLKPYRINCHYIYY